MPIVSERSKRDQDDLELGPGPPDDAGEDVGRLDGRAHQVVARRRLELREAVTVRPELVEVVRRHRPGRTRRAG